MDTKFVFFGTPEFSVTILEELKKGGFTPALIITNPDRPKGRKLILTPPPVKIWAEENNIDYIQPDALNAQSIIDKLKSLEPDLFIVASYGSIISKEILKIPKRGAINVHTSLLPKFRGASPIETAILAGERKTGTTIMLMDEKMDHGDILAQEELEISPDTNAETLEQNLAIQGGKLLSKTIPKWLSGEISPIKQKHEEASYCKKISKADGEIIDADSEEMKYRKYLAYYVWPKTFFFKEGKRFKITEAKFENGQFIIEKVIPEGGHEIIYRV